MLPTYGSADPVLPAYGSVDPVLPAYGSTVCDNLSEADVELTESLVKVC